MYWESAIWFSQFHLSCPTIRFPLLILDKSLQIKKIPTFYESNQLFVLCSKWITQQQQQQTPQIKIRVSLKFLLWGFSSILSKTYFARYYKRPKWKLLIGGKENLQLTLLSLEIYGLKWGINHFEIILNYYLLEFTDTKWRVEAFIQPQTVL